MGIPILIVGPSGSGKSFAIRNLNPQTTAIISVEKSRLPFNKDDDGKPVEFQLAKTHNYQLILSSLKKAAMKVYVIDDSQYLLFDEWVNNSREQGFSCYTSLAKNFYELIHTVNEKLPDDVIVFFLHHSETDANGKLQAKTIGKVLSEKLTLEGMFNIVLVSESSSEGHFFLTANDGTSCAKAPQGMFPEVRIPNDLKFVEDAVRAFWRI